MGQNATGLEHQYAEKCVEGGRTVIRHSYLPRTCCGRKNEIPQCVHGEGAVLPASLCRYKGRCFLAIKVDVRFITTQATVIRISPN